MMTEAQKQMKKYCTSIERRLNLPWDVKNRVMNDFITTIAAMREAGITDGEIFAELGSPKKVAADLNEQMKEFAYRKSPWRFVFLILAILSGGWLAFYAGMMWILKLLVGFEAGSVGVIGGADGPTAVFVTAYGPDWGLFLMAALLVIGAAGYWWLKHRKPKN